MTKRREKYATAGIDILVNLNGWFGKHRMGVFARRPAPVQVNYLGFPGTLGAPYMDYIIADAVVIPPGEERFYDEKVVRLWGSYQVNDDRGRPIADIPSRAEAGLPAQGFVFCNFNQPYKLTPDTFAVWMRILKQVEGSVLWLLDEVAPFAENIKAHVREHGVAPERILFAPHLPPAQRIWRASAWRIFSWTGLPYNAHTTRQRCALGRGAGVDTDWHGFSGPGCRQPACRRARSPRSGDGQCRAISERLAVTLATNPAALAAIKRRLTRSCPLFDTDFFRRQIEAAYEKMWQTWLEGKPPAGFGPITSGREP